MSVYCAEVMGWMTIIEADSKDEAVRIARARAPQASLLRSDVTYSSVRPATEEDIDWSAMMSRGN